jgi:tRNA-modifying protein YgfZ
MSEIFPTAVWAGRVVDLRERCVYELRGPDRVRYLNGQVTQNIAKVTAERTSYALVATAKGKIEAEIGVRVCGDALRLDAPGELRESLWLRLNKYLISDDCEWTDVTDEWQLLHQLGQGSEERFFLPGTDLWQPRGTELEPAAVLTPDELTALCVSRQLPRWGHELSADVFPQEARLDETHVDFHKGCYLGQEIISRLRSVGQVQRQLERFELVSGSAACGELRVISTGEKAGVLTSHAQWPGTEKRIALGYLKRNLRQSELTFTTDDAVTPSPSVWRLISS